MSLRSRFLGGFIALVGLIFTVVGVGLLLTADWKTAEATVVGQCRTHTTGTNSSRTQQVCEMTWQDNGVTHTSNVTFTRNQAIYVGTKRTLQVHGDSAMEPSPFWIRLASLILGLALLATGGIMFVRAGRNGSASSASPIEAG